MSIILKFNIQTMINGLLLGVGMHDSERLSKKGFEEIKAYCETQKGLPLDKRDIPPYFEIIDTDAKTPENLDEILDANQEKYVSMKNAELKDLCKQRGIDIKGKLSNAELIEKLLASDEKEIEEDVWDNRFKSQEQFLELGVEEQVDYLEEIFGLPDDIDEESDEANNYSDDLVKAVNAYSTLSLEEEVVEKVKEIIEYYTEE